MFKCIYSSSACHLRKTLSVRKKKQTVKLFCPTCKRKIVFRNNEGEDRPNKERVGSIDRTPSSYSPSGVTFRGDFRIQEDYSSMEGINIEGNVNVLHATGNRLTDMRVLQRENDDMTGNINIQNSDHVKINETLVANDININHSSYISLDRNMVGIDQTEKEQLVSALDIFFNGRSEPDNIIKSLQYIQEFMLRHEPVLNSLGGNLKTENNKDNSVSTVLKHNLKKAGLDNLQKAMEIGLGKVWQWIISLSP